MDTSLYRAVNRFAERTAWLHGPAAAYAKYGVLLFAVLLLIAWWRARSTGDLSAEARVAWAGVATLLSLLIGQIIAHLVD
ncbi:MAG: UDP-diphosphatase, partial [Aquihabitans sp.]